MQEIVHFNAKFKVIVLEDKMSKYCVPFPFVSQYAKIMLYRTQRSLFSLKNTTNVTYSVFLPFYCLLDCVFRDRTFKIQANKNK